MGVRTGRRPMAPGMCPCGGLVQSSHSKQKERLYGGWEHRTLARSLLDAEGPIETARQGRDANQAEDHRVDLVIRVDMTCSFAGH